MTTAGYIKATAEKSVQHLHTRIPLYPRYGVVGGGIFDCRGGGGGGGSGGVKGRGY